MSERKIKIKPLFGTANDVGNGQNFEVTVLEGHDQIGLGEQWALVHLGEQSNLVMTFHEFKFDHVWRVTITNLEFPSMLMPSPELDGKELVPYMPKYDPNILTPRGPVRREILTSFELTRSSMLLRLKAGTYHCDRDLISYVRRYCDQMDIGITQLLVEDCDFIIPCDMVPFGYNSGRAFIDLLDFQDMRIKITLHNCTTKSHLHQLTIIA